jgi:hypothetical protein
MSTRGVLKRLLAVLLSAGAVVAVSAPAAAEGGSPSPARGTFTLTTLVVTSTRTAGGNTFIEATSGGVTSGTFNGPWTEVDHLLVRTDGSIVGQAFGKQTVSGGPCVPTAGSFNYRSEVSGPSLAGLAGRLHSIDFAATVPVHTVYTFVPVGPSLWSYSGKYKCS